MISFASEPTPLDIEDVQHLRETAGEIRLRVSGHWRGASPPSAAESALLVIQIEGRRHRFAPVTEPDPSSSATAGRWSASFVVPAWAEPRREGQAALWIGEAVVPVPPIGASRLWPGARPPVGGQAVPADLPDEAAEAVSALSGAAAAGPPVRGWDPPEPSFESGRAGPLADMLLKETVAALHVELDARAEELTRVRGALGDAQSELEVRTASQAELEATLGELGTELRRLMQAADEQRVEFDRRETDDGHAREEFERRVAELSATCEDQTAELIAVREELASARAELAGTHDRHAAELAATREGHAAEFAAMSEAYAAKLAVLNEGHAAELAALHEGHAAELAATREGHATELDALGEQQASSSGVEREQAAAAMRELNAELGVARAAARRHADENRALREELAAARVSGEVARSEVAGLRAELERLGGEVAVTREHIDSETGDLGEANRLLADARALAEQLRAPPSEG